MDWPTKILDTRDLGDYDYQAPAVEATPPPPIEE